MKLLVVGASHTSAPHDTLAKLAALGNQPDLLPTLLGEHVNQAVLLVTCNRVEVYAHVNAFHPAVDHVANVLADTAGLSIGDLSNVSYVHYGPDVARHLLRVASGLESLVIGEPQILGQVRSAYNNAREAHTVGPHLHELMQFGLRAAKRVRHETQLDHAGQSVISAALDTAAPHLPPLSEVRALLIGAGAMASLAGTTLRRAGIGSLTVLNRTASRGDALAARLDALAGSLDDLTAALRDADLIITATGATDEILDAATVQAARADSDKPLVICDVALPRDVDPAVTEISGVHLVNLATLTPSDAPASTAITAAERIIDAELAEFAAALRAHTVTPMVTALREHAQTVVQTELAALRNRLTDVTEAQYAEVERAMRRVVATLLHQPTVNVKQLSQRADGERYAVALAELFGLQTTGAAVSAALIPHDSGREVPGAGSEGEIV